MSRGGCDRHLKKVDLHTHSRFSDGTSTPEDVYSRAKKARLDLLILTDHDTVSGFPDLLNAAEGGSFPVFCGVEINTRRGDLVHILGYGVAWNNPEFGAHLAEFRSRRQARIARIVEKLREHGLDLTFEEVRGTSQETLGRPHVADALRRKGIVGTRQEAFKRFLMKGKPGYVDPMGPTPEEAISLIRDFGGFPVLAHPETAGDAPDWDGWVRAGLEGIEAYYGHHGPSSINRFLDLARDRGLIATGGSDYHGPGTGRDYDLGVEIPDAVMGRFLERLSKCKS